ncbi:MAG: hypothetical protein KDJ45_13540 [Hyphomicrobiaceae bacterium]|nr:hypothetical protein [Hyphomicrobiaceae bacterium]MCC0010312.1 hypothetical protein [Hyphomicrobiaceae bacterium]
MSRSTGTPTSLHDDVSYSPVGGKSSNGCESLSVLADKLEALKLKRLVLKSTLDELSVHSPVTKAHDEVFQRRFDEITDSTLQLAEKATAKPARTLEQLRAKASLAVEFIDLTDPSVANQLLWSFVTEFIVFSAALAKKGPETPEQA